SALSLISKIQEKSKDISKDSSKDTSKKTTKKLAKETTTKEDKDQLKAFELLFVHMVLNLYSDPEEATNILSELHDCYNKVFSSKNLSKSSKKSKAANGDEEEEDLQPVEVILDILLSFLIKPSALLRQVSEHVFVIFCDKMTKTGLELMLS